MKKTIFLFSSAFSRITGGIPNTAYYMLEHFRNAGNKVVAIAASDKNEESLYGSVLESKGNKLFSFLHNSIVFRRLSKKETDTKAITISLSWRYAIVPYFNRRFVDVPYVVMCHGNDVLPYGSGIKAKIEEALRKRILKKAAFICANSEFTKHLVEEIVPTNRIKVIHPCSGEVVKRHRFNINQKSLSPTILSIGRLEERKGCQYIVDAVQRMKEEYPDIKYYIAGDGPYRNSLSEHVKALDLKDKCVFLGRVSEEKKQELLDECTVLVMPSFHNVGQRSVEGFGIVFVEANAHGKPVIGTDSGGIHDAIIEGKTGFIVPERDVEKLTEAIEKTISNETTIDTEFCFQWAEKHYYSNLLNEYLVLFDEILDMSSKKIDCTILKQRGASK